jgi:hypothetical protein
MLSVAAATVATAATLPAVAGAATATVTNDAGVATSLTPPPTIGNMAPSVVTTATAGEVSYRTSITGPGGVPAASSICRTTSSAPSNTDTPSYVGNGTYTLTVRSFNAASCGGTERPTQTFTYTVNAGASVSPPGNPLLTRQPGEGSLLGWPFALAVSPGAANVTVKYGPPGFDPNTAGSFAQLDGSNAIVNFSGGPGTYAVVAQAHGSGGGTTPWSAPVTVTVLGPFDLVAAPSFPDARGPRYRLRGRVREASASGRIAVALARGRRGGRFRTVARPRIRRNGVFSASFTIRRRGVYRLRYTYRGNSTVAPGTATQRIRISTVRL